MNVEAVLEAVEHWARMDGNDWQTGLSPENVRLGQQLAAEAIQNGAFRPLPDAPRHLVIWCASNVFTAPLEWVAQFAAAGSRITLKAPSNCPAPVFAMAEAFSSFEVQAHRAPHDKALSLLEDADAVLGFGSNQAMNVLEAHLRPETARSLHGSRASLAIVEANTIEKVAEGLYLDASAYDSRGCMSPIAVFCLGDAHALKRALFDQWATQDALPLGALSLAEQAHRSRRIGTAKMLHPSNHHAGHRDPREIVVPVEDFESFGLPRLLPIHPIDSLDQLDFLQGGPWSSCATNLPHEALQDFGFHRICQPGQLQRPPLNRLHDGVDVLERLCAKPT
ncbi:MAG: acyl-CoA reductase [Myxococcota bacterium]|nr:acyl-CoA reductase [Myxococcota bacterium]